MAKTLIQELLELKLTEISMPKNLKDAIKRLTDDGYHVVGEGGYSALLQKSGAGYVLKLFSSSDDAYSEFVTLAKANPNPHFPQFFGKMTEINYEYMAVRTELLKPCPTVPIEIKQYMVNKRKKLPIPDECLSYLDDKPELKEACDLILDNLSDWYLDLKDENFMRRGSVIVFVDPVAVN